MSKGLGGNAFARNIWLNLDTMSRSHKALPSTSCDLCSCKVWNCYGQWLRSYITKKIHYLTLTPSRTKCCPAPLTSCDLCSNKVWCCYILWVRRRCIYKKIHYLTLALGSRSHKMLPSTLDIMWPMHQQSLILLHPTVKEKVHLEENTLFVLDLGSIFDLWPWLWGQSHTKCCPVPSTSCDLSSYKVWSCYSQPFRRRFIYKKIHHLIFDLDLRVKVTLNVAQYPLHHVTCSATKFEDAMSKGLECDAFTRKFKIWPLTLTFGVVKSLLWHLLLTIHFEHTSIFTHLN